MIREFVSSAVVATLGLGVLLLSGVSPPASAQQLSEAAETVFRGTVTAIDPNARGLTVGARKVTVTNQTVIRKGDTVGSFVDLIVGAFVEVEGALQVDGTVAAREIRIEGDDDHAVALVGTLLGVNGTALTVSGLPVAVTKSTEMRGDQPIDFADLKLGDRLLVRGTVEVDRSITAVRVRVLPPVNEPGHLHIAGRVTAVDPKNLAFTIGDTRILVDGQTTFEGDGLHGLSDLRIGDVVDAELVRLANGALLALEVSRHRPPPDPRGALFEFKGEIDAVGSDGITIGGKRFAVDSETAIVAGDTRITLADLRVGETALVLAKPRPGQPPLALTIRVRRR